VGVSAFWLEIDPEGTLWVGPLTWFDGTAFQQIGLPASAGNAQPDLVSAVHAPDGSIWVVVADRDAMGDPPCPKRTDVPVLCEGETDGLYVITPEAVAATE
jgi:hypothetical protein